MAYRRKGGSALTALAKRRKAKAAKDKEGKLSPIAGVVKMSKWQKRDWAETAIIFTFLVIAVIVLGAVGALFADLIFRLI